MNYHAKRKLIQNSMYVVLALVICSVMCLTVVAFVSAHRTKDKVDPAVPDKTPVEDSTAQTPETSNGETPETPDKPTSSEDELTYVLPADGYVLKGFSIDLPVWSLTMEDYRAHTGIDVSAACGSAVYAMTGGVITDISEHPLMGVSMTIIQDDGNTALYQNLATELPEGRTNYRLSGRHCHDRTVRNRSSAPGIVHSHRRAHQPRNSVGFLPYP